MTSSCAPARGRSTVGDPLVEGRGAALRSSPVSNSGTTSSVIGVGSVAERVARERADGGDVGRREEQKQTM